MAEPVTSLPDAVEAEGDIAQLAPPGAPEAAYALLEGCCHGGIRESPQRTREGFRPSYAAGAPTTSADS